MIKKHSFTWRKSIVFSATFLLIALVSVSCKKKENLIGANNINQNDLLSANGQDTFQLVTYSFEEDSTITKNSAFPLLGSYNDPTFGEVNGEIYSQLHIQSLSPDFGDLSTIVMDSFVLGLVYSGYYGKTGDQTIEIFEIDDVDGLSNDDDSTYYQFSSVSSDETIDWVDPNYQVVSMNPDDITIINEVEVPSQLRIHLDTNKAKTIMQDAALLPASFETTDAFSEYFKGLHIRTLNGIQAPGEGGAFYFNLKSASSKMTIYYTQDGEPRTYDFYINGLTTYFNKVEMDVAMTSIVQNVIDAPEQGQQEYYAQAFKTRAAVEMPTVTDIPENAVLHSAIMHLTVSHQTGVEYDPPGFVRVRREDPDNPGGYLDITPAGIASVAAYSSLNKRYSFDLRYHIQRILNGEIENTPLIISPVFYNSSADRVILNGSETINKTKPSLRILYTEF